MTGTGKFQWAWTGFAYLNDHFDMRGMSLDTQTRTLLRAMYTFLVNLNLRFAAFA